MQINRFKGNWIQITSFLVDRDRDNDYKDDGGGKLRRVCVFFKSLFYYYKTIFWMLVENFWLQFKFFRFS